MILSHLAYQPIAFDIPDGASRFAKSIFTGPLDFSSGSYILDPTQSNQLKEVQNIQSIFVDNPTTGTMTITVSGSGHILRIPPKAQAFLPLIAGDCPTITFANSGNTGIAQAWILNIPAMGVIWTLP